MLFFKINEIDKPLARVRKKEKTQINERKNERRDIMTDSTEVKINIRE